MSSNKWAGKVQGVFIAAGEGQAMVSCVLAMAEAGLGLVGDRYHSDKGTFSTGEDKSEITLIELETLEALSRDFDIDLGPHENRRNIVTSGVPLNHLVGVTFQVGPVTLVGLRLAEPCGYLEKLTGKPVKGPLKHRGGLRATIKTGGPIRVGDVVSPV
jgi:MOSC domain-containing protein YiiM